MANYDSNYAIAQQISARLGNSPSPFDSVYSICLQIYQELGGVEQDFDSVYSILLEILPLVDGGIASKVIDDTSIRLDKTWSSSKIASELANAGFQVEIVTELPSVGDPHTIYFILKSDSSTGDVYDEWMYIDGNWELVGNTQIDLSDYATINYVDEQIETLIGNANSEIDGKETEDFTFVQTLPAEGEEDQLVVIKGDNTDSLYKYVSGEWVEQTPDANKLYFDVENEALYSYVTAQHQFAPVSLVNTIVVGSNLNSNADLKALKTPGVYSVVQRLHNATKGDYIKNWTLYVESVDYEEYDKSDSVYQRLVSNYTIQKRTWSATRASNDGWSSFSTYYAGEIKDSTTSKYYTWSSDKLNTQLGAKQDVLTAGAGIDISNGVISATGGGGSVDMMIEVTYAELKALRDNKQLVPGQQYRITDYVTTTAQVNTQSAGHQFDIIVVADSEDKLNENARAIQHSGDTYFANSKLESWELKYCLDNDTNRFSWAQAPGGTGVIYHMKDEWNNECPYDFKNIQFKRWEVTAYSAVPSLVVDGEDNYYGYYYGAKGLDDNNVLSNATYGSNSGWFYTFALKDLASSEWYDYTVVNSLGLKSDEENEIVCYGNKIKEVKDEYNSGKGEIPIMLNNIVFFNCYTDLSDTSYAEDYSDCFYNTFGNDCDSNTFGNSCGSNTFTTNYNTSQSNKLQYINILSGYSARGAVPSGIVLNVNYSQTVGLNSQGVFTVKNPLD